MPSHKINPNNNNYKKIKTKINNNKSNNLPNLKNPKVLTPPNSSKVIPNRNLLN